LRHARIQTFSCCTTTRKQLKEPGGRCHSPDWPRYGFHMTKIEDIEKAISNLSPDELAEFRACFEVFDSAQFDAKIERDAQAGKLDGFADAAIAEFTDGRAREL
jgi:hypothetical protein